VTQLVEQLEARVRELETALKHELSGGGVWGRRWVCFGPALAVLAVLAVAFVLVTTTTEGGSWEAATAAILVGLIAPGWSWGRARRLFGWLVASVFKVAVLGLWAWEFWAPARSRVVDMDSSLGVFDAGFYFFWGAPAFILAAVVLEGIAVYALWQREPQPAAMVQ